MQDALKADVFETIVNASDDDGDLIEDRMVQIGKIIDIVVDRLRRGGISDAVIRGTLCDAERERAAN